MGPVLVGWEITSIIDLAELAFSAGKRIADPAIEFPILLFKEKFPSIGPALSEYDLGFDVLIGYQLRSVLIVDLVLEIAVIELGREFILVIMKIPVIARRDLVGKLRFYIIAAGDPDIRRVGGCGIGQQVQVLRGPGIRQLDRAAAIQFKAGRKTGLKVEVILYNFSAGVSCRIHGIPILIIGIEITGSHYGETVGPQTIVDVQIIGQGQVMRNISGAFQGMLVLNGNGVEA